MISWRVSKYEANLIDAIVTRAMKNCGEDKLNSSTLSMDLTACHANGTSLDLHRLLAAPEFDFAHDIFGISRHINRKTGKLEDHFLPRYATRHHPSTSDVHA